MVERWVDSPVSDKSSVTGCETLSSKRRRNLVSAHMSLGCRSGVCESERMSGTSIKMEKSEESLGGGWSGGRCDRDSSSDGAGGGVGENNDLDPQLWHACAGGLVQLPLVGTKVIYFPQGHGEQAAATPEFPRTLRQTGTFPSRVLSVSFLADKETDEVYTRMCLKPLEPGSDSSLDGDEGPPSPPLEKPASFAKTLTQSDANNGGGFSVPRYCAETIFPPLDYTIDPPVQTVIAKDVHGDRWKFRHIYRGTPRRHLLTTGWSTFVNNKKLVAGDAIVFLRTASGELCVGVRRSMRGAGGSDSSTWSAGSTNSHRPPNRWEVAKPTAEFSDFLGADSGPGSISLGVGPMRGPGSSNSGPGVGSATSSFARNRARVSTQSVLQAVSLASRGQPFEVVYYPRASTAEFCVKAKAVKSALEHSWYPGMRFKMPFETEDSSRISWFMGTIAAVQPADPLWPMSSWRVLQVNWDEPDLLQGVSRVSPWQVEVVSTLPMQLPPLHLPKKKLRASQPSELSLQGGPMVGMPMPVLPSHYGQVNPWGHGHHLEENLPGPLGVRHERISGLGFSDQYRPGKMATGFLGRTDGFCNASVSGRTCPPVDPHMNAYPLQLRRDNGNHITSNMVSSVGKAVSQEDRGSASAGTSPASPSPSPSTSTPAGASTSSRSGTSASFVLFGQVYEARNPDSNRSQPQHSGGSSSDCPSSLQQAQEESPVKRKGSPSVSTQIEHSENSHKYMQQNVPTDGKWNDGRWNEGKCNGVGNSLKWMLGSDQERNAEDVLFCKVFFGSDLVGRAVDLLKFSSYEELYENLAGMYSLEAKRLVNGMVYIDSKSMTKTVGFEPYRVFANTAKRLTIISEMSYGKLRT